MPNTTQPMYIIVTSSIRFSAQHERPQTEDGWNPDAHEDTLVLAAGEPQVNGQQERDGRSYQKTNLGKLKFAHCFLHVNAPSTKRAEQAELRPPPVQDQAPPGARSLA